MEIFLHEGRNLLVTFCTVFANANPTYCFAIVDFYLPKFCIWSSSRVSNWCGDFVTFIILGIKFLWFFCFYLFCNTNVATLFPHISRFALHKYLSNGEIGLTEYKISNDNPTTDDLQPWRWQVLGMDRISQKSCRIYCKPGKNNLIILFSIPN